MRIKLLNMKLLNFKGVRELEVNFGDITTISGDNGCGKTTVFDAFTWLLFGKNSGDAKEFNIKTLDKDNNPIHKLEHQVTATLDVDDRHVKLKRQFREKWVKKRGEEKAEFAGHETQFFIDDVPLSQNEYKARVDFIIKEDIAKLITNPLYFNQMKWNERRAVLEAMAGAITDADILDKISNSKNKTAIANLASVLGSGKKLEEYKKQIGSQKKKIKETLELIPTRIDEAKRAMPIPGNFSSIEKSIAAKQEEIKAIESEMEDATKKHQATFDEIRKKNEELNKLKIDLGKAESQRSSIKQNKISEIQSKINGLKSGIASKQNQLKSIQVDIDKYKKKQADLEEANVGLRKQWEEENARELQIDPHKYDCPACKQLLPEDQRENMKETLTKNFNEHKTRLLESINNTGKANKTEIERLTALVNSMQESITPINDQISVDERSLTDLNDQLEIVSNQDECVSDLEVSLKKQIDAFVIPESPKIDNDSLKEERTKIAAEIDSLKQELSAKDQIAKLNIRITELEAEEKTLSQELADLERTEFTIDAFNKAKVETIEKRTNDKFSLVKFKMFEQQINGGEVECCECMVNGVPYSDVNTAGKINAGIDIINALCEHYKINAPIWIDNRESIIRILQCNSQIINLRAVKDAKLSIVIEEVNELETA